MASFTMSLDTRSESDCVTTIADVLNLRAVRHSQTMNLAIVGLAIALHASSMTMTF